MSIEDADETMLTASVKTPPNQAQRLVLPLVTWQRQGRIHRISSPSALLVLVLVERHRSRWRIVLLHGKSMEQRPAFPRLAQAQSLLFRKHRDCAGQRS